MQMKKGKTIIVTSINLHEGRQTDQERVTTTFIRWTKRKLLQMKKDKTD